MSTSGTTLHELGVKYGTDKASAFHNYLHFYGEFLAGFVDKPINIIEFGCLTGASLSMWAEYFPKAQVIGVDIDISSCKVSSDRIKLVQADATNPFELTPLFQEYPPTLVIDDASHIWWHQILTFELCFHHLLPGGVYICEDMETSFAELRDPDFLYAKGPLDGAQYFAKLALLVLGNNTVHPLLQDVSVRMQLMLPYIDYMLFRNHCVFLKRAQG